MEETGPERETAPLANFFGPPFRRFGRAGLSAASSSKLISRTTSGLEMFVRDRDLASWALLSAVKGKDDKG